MKTLRAARPVRMVLIGACCLAVALAWGGARPLAARPGPAAPAAASRAPNAAAAEVASRRHYQKFCARCHDDDFKGGILRETIPNIPDFTDAAWQRAQNFW